MTTLAIDFSYSGIDPGATARAGYSAMLEYLSPQASKNCTPGRAQAAHAAGLGIGLVWESTGSRALDGAAAGTADGQTASAQADALGVPNGAPLLANIGDFAASPGQMPAIEAYYRAFQAACAQHRVSRPAGGYGTAFIIDQCVAAGCTGYWWQNAMNDAGESGSNVSPNTTIYQRVSPTRTIAGWTSGWDEDAVVKPYPFWTNGQPPTPGPAPAPPAPPSPPVHGPDGNPWTLMKVDGVFGPGTCCALQWTLDHTGASPRLATDGLFGTGTKRALQLRLNAVAGPVAADGVIGVATIKAMQRHTGANPDGVWGPATTEAMQRSMNAGTF